MNVVLWLGLILAAIPIIAVACFGLFLVFTFLGVLWAVSPLIVIVLILVPLLILAARAGA